MMSALVAPEADLEASRLIPSDDSVLFFFLAPFLEAEPVGGAGVGLTLVSGASDDPY